MARGTRSRGRGFAPAASVSINSCRSAKDGSADLAGRGNAMRRLVAALAVAIVALVAPARGQDVADFYKRNRINLIVGYGPGGGYDVYARILARHMGKHIPGNPTIIIQNMPGAGSLRATN